MIICRPASPADLELIWDNDFAQSPEWPLAWKESSVRDNAAGLCKAFGIFDGEAAIGTGTLLFSSECEAINGRPELADGVNTANINALRINKPYRGQGHISKLVRMMEQYARDAGYGTLTIGVEPKESRNLAIYLHWGYDKFIMPAFEEPLEDDKTEEKDLVLYYAKQL